MGDPPGHKNRRCCRGQIGGILGKGGRMQEIPNVIQGHNDHDQTTSYINGDDALHAGDKGYKSQSILISCTGTAYYPPSRSMTYNSTLSNSYSP